MGDHSQSQAASDDNYQPQNAVGMSIRSATLTGGAGLFLAAVQNTVAKENIGPFGVFTRFGKTIAVFGAMGGAYSFFSIASANLREKEDPYNHALGGFVAGSLIGLRNRAMASVVGHGLALAVTTAAISYTGASIFSPPSGESAIDSVQRKEEARMRFRRPVAETINEIGEGRGIYGPGYEERRKQRIKANYGIDVQEPYYNR